MSSIQVFAPATVANVACGFDIFGFAVDNPGDEVIVKRKASKGIVITKITGDDGKLTLNPEKNTVTVPMLAYLKAIGSDDGFEVELHKKMPLGSGLGSSSASAVAGVFALNALFNNQLSTRDLLPFSMEGERIACGSAHADNVAPALFGGFVIIRSYSPLDVFKIKTPENLYCTIVHPDIEVNTKDARHILRAEVSLKNTIIQMGNVAGMVAGLLTNDFGLIGRSMQDVIIEPVRSILIPEFQNVKNAALANGALGCSISGAGPSIFALSEGLKNAQNAANAMKKVFNDSNIETNVFVSGINQNGPRIVG
jgi:homoserine kinase